MSSWLTFFEWELNQEKKTLRLSAIHEQVVLRIYLARKSTENAFCTSTFDAISKQYFPTNQWPSMWIPPKRAYPWKESEEEHPVASKLLDLIRSQLPGALQTYKTKMQMEHSLLGSFLLVSVEDDPDKPDQASLIIQDDLYRKYVFADLQYLAPDCLGNIPRIDLSEVVRYVATLSPNTFKVLVKLDSSSEQPAVLKIAIRFGDWEGPERTSNSLKNGKIDQSRMLEEVQNVYKLSGHPNTADAPLALVTIHDNAQGGCEKLVGWLQRVYEELSVETWLPHKYGCNISLIPERIGWAIDLARGMSHMQRKGFIHPDVHKENVLFYRHLGKLHLVIIDYEETFGNWYNNCNGPNSPEAAGFWEATQSDGQLTYTLNAGTVDIKQHRIKRDLAGCAEALERLQVFTFAWVAARLLDYHIPFKHNWPDDYIKIVGKEVGHWPDATPEKRRQDRRDRGCSDQEKDDTMRDTWEKLIPDRLKGLLDRCCAFNPLERPLLEEIIQTVVEIGNQLADSKQRDATDEL